MLSERFVATHRETWEQLSSLLDRAERSGLASLEPPELEELGRLYRRVTAHLSEARTTGVDAETVGYINQLVGRAYARIYAGSRARRFSLRDLFAVEVPRTFRRRARFIGVSFGISILAALLAYGAVRADARWAGALTSRRGAEQWDEFARSGSPAGEYFAEAAASAGGTEFAGFLMSNNIRVALTAFALGITLGLGTVFILTVNGLMLGTFFGVGGNADSLLRFAAIICPHGIAELSAIFIAGGAGLMLGHAIVDPGDLPRVDALRIAALDAVKLVAGTIPVFIVAGIIEGIISPQHEGLFGQDIPRILFGLLVGVAFWLYLFFGDRLWGAPPDY